MQRSTYSNFRNGLATINLASGVMGSDQKQIEFMQLIAQQANRINAMHSSGCCRTMALSVMVEAFLITSVCLLLMVQPNLPMNIGKPFTQQSTQANKETRIIF